MFLLSLFLTLSIQLQADLHTCDAVYSGNVLIKPGSCPNIVVQSSCTLIDEEAFYTSTIESIDCTPASQLTRIGFRAFYQCVNLKTVNLPSSLKIIQSNAFFG
ncbi:hypothetical protein TVAG_420300 [Trichomonas vaginalis G3]|uniref:Surface antigen BspA-like n=1 Tax=Trichomonas vaginalis (strain ATCC PRA-98 / G3) TaxID=412133 RepID=A2ED53_TRIV3|nr:ribonuclease inhibitor domain-containing protein [Trichomonas vaginalis G3]EAY09408.1 hypothetical protein TVAG_420300 [Trichomonas vaginalis G3]KAI5536328.1 ribonuclease inhibitor domain-containing protein [Trichomonas vaginalis G3]|eukprot:XP_001321631.1 hypothetical protein [Trichomonas vaginalis G3]